MKSNTCVLKKGSEFIPGILAEVDKVCKYNELPDSNALRVHLLAEELCGMLPGLVENFDGTFWVENEGNAYELHAEFVADNMTIFVRDQILSVSKSGKNAAAKGIMGKIRAIAETMILAASDPDLMVPAGDYYDFHGYNMGLGYIDPTIAIETGYMYSWSLYSYRAMVEQENSPDAFDELERSIVAKLADDIVVGVRGNKVEIIVKKTF